MTRLRSIRLDGEFRLLSPLSHIGETISSSAYLAEDRILQDDGSVEPVFCYSGNAWRGQLRDLAAAYMLDRLGAARVPLDTFHLLFSGGRIGGAQSIDIAQAREMRALIPMLALWGGGVGNQIMQGKMRVGNCYPVCAEARPVLPDRLHEAAAAIPYAACTMEKEHSRRDDAKIESVRRHLGHDSPAALLPDAREKPRKDADGPETQMRMKLELVSPGVRLHSWIEVMDATEVELGALVSALHSFSRSPMIGGKGAVGYGRVDLAYTMTDLDTGESMDFCRVADGRSLLAPPAAAAREAYDQHLRSLYDSMITSEATPIRKALGAA